MRGREEQGIMSIMHVETLRARLGCLQSVRSCEMSDYMYRYKAQLPCMTHYLIKLFIGVHVLRLVRVRLHVYTNSQSQCLGKL